MARHHRFRSFSNMGQSWILENCCRLLGWIRVTFLPYEEQRMNTAKEIICFVILFAPYLWEVIDDRHGDLNKKIDVLWRVLIGAAASLFVWVMTGHSLWATGFMCFAIFFLLFDYTIAAVLIRNKVIAAKDWFGYMGKKGITDNIGWWRDMKPGWRFAVRFAVFAIALVFYFWFHVKHKRGRGSGID